MQAMWSIHDVSPSTATWADAMVGRLTLSGVSRVTILIIPAGEWAPDAVDLLRGWESAGHILALHGWDHQARRPASLYHRMHSLVLSRDAAEHLSRGKAEMLARIERGRAWFGTNGLVEPDFYVPPAWAAGAVTSRDLGGAGFRRVETLTGITETSSGRTRLLPLVGFEADNLWRSIALRVSNAANTVLARLTGRPVRIAVHPNDDAKMLAGDLDRWIHRGCRPVLPG